VVEVSWRERGGLGPRRAHTNAAPGPPPSLPTDTHASSGALQPPPTPRLGARAGLTRAPHAPLPPWRGCTLERCPNPRRRGLGVPLGAGTDGWLGSWLRVSGGPPSGSRDGSGARGDEGAPASTNTRTVRHVRWWRGARGDRQRSGAGVGVGVGVGTTAPPATLHTAWPKRDQGCRVRQHRGQQRAVSSSYMHGWCGAGKSAPPPSTHPHQMGPPSDPTAS
jgi:hypothetical protein